jgi:hypothetical protein
MWNRRQKQLAAPDAAGGSRETDSKDDEGPDIHHRCGIELLATTMRVLASHVEISGWCCLVTGPKLGVMTFNAKQEQWTSQQVALPRKVWSWMMSSWRC